LNPHFPEKKIDSNHEEVHLSFRPILLLFSMDSIRMICGFFRDRAGARFSFCGNITLVMKTFF